MVTDSETRLINRAPAKNTNRFLEQVLKKEIFSSDF